MDSKYRGRIRGVDRSIPARRRRSAIRIRIPSQAYFFDRRAFRGPSDFNVGQVLTINYIWPSAAAGSKWTLGMANSRMAIGRSFAGQYRPSLYTPNWRGPPWREQCRPIRLSKSYGPGCQSLVNPGNVKDYIKLNCFTLPTPTPAIAALCTPFSSAPGTCQNLIGNAGRNEIVGPGFVNFDFSLVKNNYVRENFNIQFRAEFFNLFNRSNFASPVANDTLFDQTGAPIGGAGAITQTANASRQIQFGVKVIW